MKKYLVVVSALCLSACDRGSAVSVRLGSLDPALVAAYNFDDGAGATLTDLTPNHLNGALSGQTWTTAGKYGGALAFNGAAPVTVADATPLHLSRFTLSAWVYPTGGGSWQTLAAKDGAGALPYALYVQDGAHPRGRIVGTSQVDVSAGTFPAANAWTYLAVTYDGTAVRLYEATGGGALALVGSANTTQAIAASTSPFRIGGNGVYGDGFVGRADDLRIYSEARTLAQLTNDMNTPLSGGGGAGGSAGGTAGAAGGSAGAPGTGGSASGGSSSGGSSTGGASSGGSSSGGASSGGAVGSGGAITCGSTGGATSSGGTSSGGAVGSGGTPGSVGAGGSAGAGGALSCGFAVEPFFSSSTPYVRIMTPIPGQTFLAPATLRLWAHGDSPSGYPASVSFYLGSTLVATVPQGGVDYYQADVTGLAPGTYDVYARSGTAESPHVPVTVVGTPTYGQTLALTSDLVFSGTADLDVVGTPTSRALVTSSNGSRIVSAAGWTGHVNIQNADIVGLGSMDAPAIDVTTTGAVSVVGATFDRSGPPRLIANGSSPIAISDSTFGSNTLATVNYTADYEQSRPSLVLGGSSGSSSAPNVFTRNRVGVSFLRFESSHWSITGNVMVGVRAGAEFIGVSDVTVRGNYIHHRYPYGWSQGHVLDVQGANSAFLIEHNILRGSSWTVAGLSSGVVCYNLFGDINESIIRACDNTDVHHNVVVDLSIARTFYPSAGLQFGSGGTFRSNTVDAGGAIAAWHSATFAQSPVSSLRNNAFLGFAYFSPGAPVVNAAAFADYNAFWMPDAEAWTRYSGVPGGTHDIGTTGAGVDPQFPARVTPWPFSDGDLWSGCVTTADVLAYYRAHYTPGSGSPLIDAGDPADDVGAAQADIGAVGAGAAHPDDLFGMAP